MENHIDDLSHELGQMRKELNEIKSNRVKARVQAVVSAVSVKLNDVKIQFIFLKQTFVNNVKSVLHNVKEAGMSALQKITKALHIRPALLHLKGAVLTANKAVVQSAIQVRDTCMEMSAARSHLKNAFARIRGGAVPTAAQKKADRGILSKLEAWLSKMDSKLQAVSGAINTALLKVMGIEERKSNYKKPVKADLREIQRKQEKQEKSMPAPQKQKSGPKHSR